MTMKTTAAHDMDPQTSQAWLPPSESEEQWRRIVDAHVAAGRWEEVLYCERFYFRTVSDRCRRREALMRSGDRWWRRAREPARTRARYQAALQANRLDDRAAARPRALGHSRHDSQPYVRAAN